MRTLPFLAALAPCLALGLLACGDDSGSTVDAAKAVDAKAVDSGIPIDAAADAPPAPAMITLSGNVVELTGGNPSPTVEGAMLTAYKVSDDSVLGTATSGANGAFSITVTTGGIAVNGYLKVTYVPSGTNPPTYKETYLYPPGVLTADFTNVPIYIIKESTYGTAQLLLGNGSFTATEPFIGVLIEDSAGTPVAGATVSSTPAGTYGYNNNHLPSGGATSTADDGIAYITKSTAGQVLVSAAKAGSTFISHTIKARANQLTLTIITE